MDLVKLGKRVHQGLGRKQVIVGKDKVTHYVRGGRIGLVWLMEDLGHGPKCKIKGLCDSVKVPLLIAGKTDDIDAYTGLENCKVYLLKQEFSGLKQILREFEQYQQEEKERQLNGG